ncbi:MAG: STAS domain-containing protein [Magnetococcales bacterium]|nr:STAS domain-containing protein [Magnetococcales bacterium]
MPTTGAIIESVDENDVLTIYIKGALRFKAYADFKEAYQGVSKDYTFIVDLGEVEMVDSSGLGMLMTLREYAGGESANITLANCRPVIKSILISARFQDLFKMH